MDKWQKYLSESRERGSGAGLERSLSWFLDQGPQKKGGYKNTRTRFGRKKFNDISAPPGAAGGGALEEEVEEETFEMNATLKPEIWKGLTLNPKVADKLLGIAEDFLENLEIEVDMLDLRITGSLANFNWSKYSDVDLHIVVDFATVDEDLILVKAYFDAARAKWNDLHNITIKRHEVEIYVENANEEHVSSGIYSILGERWIVEPTQKEIEIDFAQARKKSDSIQTRTALIGYQVEAGDYKGALTAIDRVKSKIRRMRAAGLDSPQREFSPENIAFKILRREEILKQLNDLKYNAYDNMMSIKERRECEV
jgi:predicted nucleotidyltransferase